MKEFEYIDHLFVVMVNTSSVNTPIAILGSRSEAMDFVKKCDRKDWDAIWIEMIAQYKRTEE